VVDPARRVAAVQSVNDVPCVDMKVKRVVGVRGVVRVARLRFFPGDDLADVFNNGFASGNRLHGKNALAVNAGAADLDAT